MRNAHGLAEAEDRLDPKEIEELRRRLNMGFEDSHKRESEGFSTVRDLAEAFGVPTEAVLAHLDRLRTERAFQPKQEPKKQTGLVALAGALFVAALAIYALTPHKLSDAEVEARAKELSDAQVSRRKGIVAQFELEDKKSLPPSGIRFVVTGARTKVTAIGSRVMGIPTEAKAIALLADSLRAAFDQEVRQESKEGTDHSEQFGIHIAAFSIIYDGQIAATTGSTTDQFKETAVEVVSRLKQSQDAAFGPSAIRLGLPPGLVVRLNGRREGNANGPSFALSPVDAGKAGVRLLEVLQNLLEDDLRPPNPASQLQTIADSKIPIPPFTTVSITSPLGKLDFEVPTAASPKYPTAADAVRARDKILRDNVNKVVEQIDRLNHGAAPTLTINE